MARSKNAQVAVDLYEQLRAVHGWTATDAWHGIARLLLHCDIWQSGWKPFRGSVVYREVNDFKDGASGSPNIVLRRAETLTAYLGAQLGVPSADVCANIGLYWRLPQIENFQPHNLVGHAFRSITVHALHTYGDPGLTYEEEVDPHREFPGFQFSTRSKKPKIDIVARRGQQTVALMSSRWRFRHDRVDVVEEALAYATAARRQRSSCRLFAVIGEFAPNRLEKILTNCPPLHSNPPLDAAVHFAPQLITDGLKENGRMKYLRGLDWLIEDSHNW